MRSGTPPVPPPGKPFSGSKSLNPQRMALPLSPKSVATIRFAYSSRKEPISTAFVQTSCDPVPPSRATASVKPAMGPTIDTSSVSGTSRVT